MRRPNGPADGLDPYRLAAQVQVIRVMVMVAAKAGIDAALEGSAAHSFPGIFTPSG